MKPDSLLLTVGLCAAAAMLIITHSKAQSQTRAERVQRGEYLVKYGGCADCHTPKRLGPNGPEFDPTRHLAGHPAAPALPEPPSMPAGPWSVTTAGQTAWSGPWGISFAANLTPDINTGLGIWTEEMFVRAMRTGKHFGAGRDILPPMPWQSLAALGEDDLRAIYAYLRSIPPVPNRVPDPLPPTGVGGYE